MHLLGAGIGRRGGARASRCTWWQVDGRPPRSGERRRWWRRRRGGRGDASPFPVFHLGRERHQGVLHPRRHRRRRGHRRRTRRRTKRIYSWGFDPTRGTTHEGRQRRSRTARARSPTHWVGVYDIVLNRLPPLAGMGTGTSARPSNRGGVFAGRGGGHRPGEGVERALCEPMLLQAVPTAVAVRADHAVSIDPSTRPRRHLRAPRAGGSPPPASHLMEGFSRNDRDDVKLRT